MRTLERKLEAKMIKEESDYHDLESVVQQVERNLELMTVSRRGPCRQGESWAGLPGQASQSIGCATPCGEPRLGAVSKVPSLWAAQPLGGPAR